MPISKYFKGHGEEVMSNMTKEYGKKKGKSVFYATANKRSVTGSGPFSASDQQRGYKVMCDATELQKMNTDKVANAGPLLARRVDPKKYRRSESTKGSY